LSNSIEHEEKKFFILINLYGTHSIENERALEFMDQNLKDDDKYENDKYHHDLADFVKT
jgi:hypothetical protein